MQPPLSGIDLVDCARANAKQGLHATAKLCGYGDNLEQFEQALVEAGQQIGIDIQSLNSLLVDVDNFTGHKAIEVAPDTQSSL